MSTLTNQELESYLPVYDAVPDKWEEARPFFVEAFKRISNAVNAREIGWFINQQLLTGKQFSPSSSPIAGTDPSQQFRSVFRKVIDFGALPNNTSKSVAHGLTVDNNFTLTALYAAATNPSTFGSPSLGEKSRRHGQEPAE